MGPSNGGVTQKVDIRFPLSFYFRIANQIINQAKVYRDEKNLLDLYITLNRYSRLVSEIIPQHPNYSTYSTKERLHHKKILKKFAQEMETLKPKLGKKLDEINRQHAEKPKNSGNDSHLTSQTHIQRDVVGKDKFYEGVEDRSDRKFSTNCVFTARRGSTQRCISAENVVLASAIKAEAQTSHDINVHVVTQSSPSPILSCIQSAPHAAHVSHISVADSRNKNSKSSFEGSVSKAIHDVHISVRLMEDFLELARANTDNDLETCGVLGAFLKNRTFYVTTLIIPKQESTSSTCQTLNEEEIYAVHDEKSLFPVGWIHTHPSQSCFMSSIDLHTHYSYQVMLPEALAIVMAPTDATRSYGIFRLSDPVGTSVLKECQERGFHPHQEPADGSPIYEDCSNVYINPNLRFEIIDLR
ncbi:hypothetical protein AAC387_Pa10g1566 [Persea americana]